MSNTSKKYLASNGQSFIYSLSVPDSSTLKPVLKSLQSCTVFPKLLSVSYLFPGQGESEADKKKREREEKRLLRQKELQEKREAKKAGSGAMKLGAKKLG
jgi:hypothetical protein